MTEKQKDKNLKGNPEIDEKENSQTQKVSSATADIQIEKLKMELEEKTTELEKLKKEVSELSTKANNYLNTASYYKAQAENNKKDFDRFKERNKNIEIEASHKACTIAAKQLIPIIDNFNSAMEALSPDVMRGFGMIYSSFLATLKELGVMELNTKDESFDPEKHECIERVETDDKNLDNKIAKTFKKGYIMAETNEIVRHATVSVYKFTSN